MIASYDYSRLEPSESVLVLLGVALYHAPWLKRDGLQCPNWSWYELFELVSWRRRATNPTNMKTQSNKTCEIQTIS